MGGLGGARAAQRVTQACECGAADMHWPPLALFRGECGAVQIKVVERTVAFVDSFVKRERGREGERERGRREKERERGRACEGQGEERARERGRGERGEQGQTDTHGTGIPTCTHQHSLSKYIVYNILYYLLQYDSRAAEWEPGQWEPS